VVLAQVLIEAYVIEVTLGDSRDLGVSYLQKQPSSIGNYFKGVGAINGINSQNGLSPGSSLTSSATNAVASLPGGFSYLGSLGQDLDVALTAVQNDSHARILQRPRVQTSHNEPAHLFVGESRPYPTASYYGGAYGGSASIQQVPIGVTLEVTPLINPDGLVVMDISADIQSEAGTVAIANVGNVPITSQKSATAKVSVRDRDTIMLGGLIATSKSKSSSGVPLLMNIPLLGYLFRSTSDKSDRSEMIVLIRPTVLPTPEVAALNTKLERNRMPLIKHADADIEKEEEQRLKLENKPAKKVPEFEPVEGR
jgi:general secretion pathway protein D